MRDKKNDAPEVPLVMRMSCHPMLSARLSSQKNNGNRPQFDGATPPPAIDAHALNRCA